MKIFYFCEDSPFIYAQGADGRVYWSTGQWFLSVSEFPIVVSFDTVAEALEYWPDHVCDGWKCSEHDWFEKYMQAVMKELL